MNPELPPGSTAPSAPRTSALAIASFILGVFGFVLALPAIASIVCAILAFVKIKRSRGGLTGTGFAITGVLVSVMWLLVGFAFFTAVTGEVRAPRRTFVEARKGFATQLARRERADFPVPEPPASQLKTVQYRSPAGAMAAYLSIIPDDGKKHPAIVWLTGGFSNSISAAAWEPAEESNDQSARSFRAAGVVTLYPSLRGGNENPGFRETLFGEVDDVLAAADFLATQPGIDASRIYLGGHSTGGTLALLVAESSPRFRAVFAFGPVARILDYGEDVATFDVKRPGETDVRNPVKWLAGINTPTFVFEGESGRSNIESLRTLMRATRNQRIQFHPVPGKDHFSTLAPYSRIIAKQIIEDTGPAANFHF